MKLIVIIYFLEAVLCSFLRGAISKLLISQNDLSPILSDVPNPSYNSSSEERSRELKKEKQKKEEKEKNMEDFLEGMEEWSNEQQEFGSIPEYGPYKHGMTEFDNRGNILRKSRTSKKSADDEEDGESEEDDEIEEDDEKGFKKLMKKIRN
ncbi:hypothetical protein NGRA_0075 [Nosema granulosis]|uniref:Uncharacterized protein n=1 Tax=Nosema granulosis TaxID=83296 RepID=A0A9P6H3N7_9MICR|nr:hypothetical protein NGRA_0075 [Nosema granulosis]